MNDFLDGKFEDLAVLNKSGLMDPFGSSLHLVEKARKRLEEKAMERIEETGLGSDSGAKAGTAAKRNK